MTDEERYFFDLNGYLLREDVLDAPSVAALGAGVDARRPPPPGETVMSQRFAYDEPLLAWGDAFVGLVDHPAVLAVLTEVLGPSPRLDHAYGIHMAPGTAGLGLHGGNTPYDPAQCYAFRDGRIRSGLLAASWAVTGSRPGDGGFGCIPGSHKANLPLPTGAAGLVREVPQPPGSVLLFTEALTHCTLPWRGPHQRRALLYKYGPGHAAWAPATPLPPEVLERLTGRQRRLVEPPYVARRRPVG